MTIRTAISIVILAASPLFGHRLDEYLQGTIISVEKTRLQVQMILTPGVMVFPFLIPEIDTDANGTISEQEQRTYADRVLHDLSLTIDGHRLAPRLLSTKFPPLEEMKEGRGEIQFYFDADLPNGGRKRKLTIENRHQNRIAAYQVNCLVPRDPSIRIGAQNRNYSQSLYELDYEQVHIRSDLSFSGLWTGPFGWMSSIAILLFTRLLFSRR